jgi:anaerobic selenocysteine-containing dehydrogenase
MMAKTVIDQGIIDTLCRQCDMRCGQEILIEGGRIKEIRGLESHPQNRGRICHKGRAAVDLVYHPSRLLKPLKRKGDGKFVEISYERAMERPLVSSSRRSTRGASSTPLDHPTTFRTIRNASTAGTSAIRWSRDTGMAARTSKIAIL